MKHRALLLILILTLVSTIVVRLRIGVGSYTDPRFGHALLVLRAHSATIAGLSGAALAVAGLLMQGLFRNPLAEPGVLGVGAGANLGGTLVMAFGEAILRTNYFGMPPELLLAFGCMGGALATLGVLLLAMRSMADTVAVLLSGVVMTTLLGSVTAIVRAVLSDKWELSRALMNIAMGDISGRGVRHIYLGAPLVLSGCGAAWLLAPHLDLLSSGEEEAATLGVDVASVRLWSVIWTALLVAAAVAMGGGVAFVGLLVPHLMRGRGNYRHSRLVPLCALGGAILLIICDGFSVAIDTKSMIPLGGITGLLGAPLFLALLLRARGQGGFR